MANIENLAIIDNSERAKELQKKSVEKRKENKIKNKLIETAIRKELTDEDLQEIARNLIARAKRNHKDLITMRDTIGEKPTEKIEADVELADIRVELRDE